MTLDALPAVAKSVYTLCKKCETERFHTVLSHTSDTVAKVKCEVCNAKRNYSIEKKKAVVKGKVSATKAAKEKVAKKSAHEKEYQQMLDSSENVNVVNYTIAGNFESGTKLNHNKFGIGFVKTSLLDKIEVVFNEEVKVLIHRRTL